MKKYRLLKDLPSLKAGAIITKTRDALGNESIYTDSSNQHDLINLIKTILDNTEWVEMIEEEEKPVRWRAKEGKDPLEEKDPFEEEEWYFTVDWGGFLDRSPDHGGAQDRFAYATGNYFKTEEEAEEHKRKLLIRQRYKDMATKAWRDVKQEIDWNNSEQPKFCAVFISLGNWECHTTSLFRLQGAIYFPTEESCKEAINDLGEDAKYLLD